MNISVGIWIEPDSFIIQVLMNKLFRKPTANCKVLVSSDIRNIEFSAILS